MTKRVILGIVFALFFLALLPAYLRMGRKLPGPDALRTAASPEELAGELHLQWVRHLPPLRAAWPDQPALQFDGVYHPVALGQTVFLASAREDSVTALDTRTGQEKWRFVTDGPVRLAPLAWRGRVYVVSDDGYLYCLVAATGELRWKRRGGPSDRKVLGNERLISTWPARGAPVVVGSKIFFGASIWPFMGVFLHALDATSGQLAWTNDGDGSIYIPQPHHADSFGGVAPQGYLVAVGNRLLIPGGRSVPACLNLDSGRLLHYRLADHSGRGGWQVAAQGSVYWNGGSLFDIESGDLLEELGQPAVLTPDIFYAYAGGELRAFLNEYPLLARKTAPGTSVRARGRLKHVAATPLPPLTSLIKAGSRLYSTTGKRVVAMDLPLRDRAEVAWQADVDGLAAMVTVGDGRLFVTTREGMLYCFGAEKVEAHVYPTLEIPASPDDDWKDKAASILAATHVRDGYCLAWGVGSGRLITELARQSKLHIVAFDPDADRVRAVREELRQAGLYGERVAVHLGTPDGVELPPYFASLMVSENLEGIDINEAFLTRIFNSLRPYGGVACLPDSCRQAARTTRGRVQDAGEWMLLTRDAAPAGAADWTHEHGDAGNTRVSQDRLVKAPLGILWFGGSTNDAILPRHGHGPQPQVVQGRLIIEGTDGMRALDIYTGRVLWETSLPALGKVYDNTHHHPGANASGSNYVATPDGIYVLYGKDCLVLDPASGKIRQEFPVPDFKREAGACLWGYLSIFEDYLVGGIQPVAENASKHPGLSSSKYLVVMNRHTGQLLWHRAAQNGFRHNAICLGNGKLFGVDRLSDDHFPWQKSPLPTASNTPQLLALDVKTGKLAWSTNKEVFGTSLSYSAEFDVLVETGRHARDTLSDEADGMRTYQGKQGKLLWHRPDYAGPAMISGRKVFKYEGACDLVTGIAIRRADPLTGISRDWTWKRGYGCNTPLASVNLLTFRSGAAGYYDLVQDGGTANLGGFRSGCTNNLIVAGGVLVAPDYTRTCTCSYQNQTSLALVHMPDAETWTYFGNQPIEGPIRRLGINLGAPGDRKADNGTLWLDHPSVGGASPPVVINTRPEHPQFYRRHSSRVTGTMPWVTASGARGLTSLSVTLNKDAKSPCNYTVRLYFAEPDTLKPGDRVFHIKLQGRQVLKNFDIVGESGGPNRSLVKDFKGVRVAADLTLSLVPSASCHVTQTVLSGIEIIAEGW